MLVSPRLTDNFDAVAVLSEAIDECDDAGGTGERVAPEPYENTIAVRCFIDSRASSHSAQNR